MKAMLVVRKCASALALAAGIAGTCLWTHGANANPGNLDTTFGAGGIVEFSLPHYDSYFDGSIATYPDASTVTVSVVLDSANNQAFSVQRFTQTGSPDL